MFGSSGASRSVQIYNSDLGFALAIGLGLMHCPALGLFSAFNDLNPPKLTPISPRFLSGAQELF